MYCNRHLNNCCGTHDSGSASNLHWAVKLVLGNPTLICAPARTSVVGIISNRKWAKEVYLRTRGRYTSPSSTHFVVVLMSSSPVESPVIICTSHDRLLLWFVNNKNFTKFWICSSAFLSTKKTFNFINCSFAHKQNKSIIGKTQENGHRTLAPQNLQKKKKVTIVKVTDGGAPSSGKNRQTAVRLKLHGYATKCAHFTAPIIMFNPKVLRPSAQ